jgi:hypothetical protein
LVAIGLMLVAAQAAGASPASALTLGETGTSDAMCDSNADRLQPSVSSGNSYVVPANVMSGTITSWSTQANAVGGSLEMKVYRHANGATYTVVAHDGPHTLAGGTLNTFTVSVPVKAGDVLGVSTPVGPNNAGCTFAVAGDNSYLYHAGNLADGESGDFDRTLALPDRRLNVSAELSGIVTGERAAALKKCKKKHSAKKRKKCRKKAKSLPV